MPKKDSKLNAVKPSRTPVKKVVKPKSAPLKAPKVERQSVSALPLRTSPKDVFLHLLMMVMLYLGVISLIALAFAYINYAFPDLLSYSYYRPNLLESIRWQSSMLIVSFPLLLLLSYFVQREFRQNPKKHELRFYKWLTYFTLFVAAVTIVVDLIQLVYGFYGGELTTAFLLKIFSVLVVAGAVFAYYIWDVQSQAYASKVPARVGWATGVVVLGMLVLGFVMAGSPSHQRQIRMDEDRVNDLMGIQNEVINYWQNKRELPKALKDLESDLSYYTVPMDPETTKAYEYNVKGDLTFELCAEFNLSNQTPKEDEMKGVIYSDPYSNPGNWSHAAGKTCFSRTIDPDLYPALPKPKE